jgi:hypothetical protein
MLTPLRVAVACGDDDFGSYPHNSGVSANFRPLADMAVAEGVGRHSSWLLT